MKHEDQVVKAEALRLGIPTSSGDQAALPSWAMRRALMEEMALPAEGQDELTSRPHVRSVYYIATSSRAPPPTLTIKYNRDPKSNDRLMADVVFSFSVQGRERQQPGAPMAVKYPSLIP